MTKECFMDIQDGLYSLELLPPAIAAAELKPANVSL
jgi:hypothetical protein